MIFIKLSIALFLLRFAVQKRYRVILWVSMALFSIWGITLVIWDIFQCTPIQAQWDPTIQDAKCVSPQQLVNSAYATSALAISSDLFYSLLPIPMVWSVKMSRQAKAGVILLLGLGILYAG
jgi:hypothetical protein